MAKRKDSKIEVRVPQELKEQAEMKARSRGWSLPQLIRALLHVYVQEDNVGPEDVGEANDRAPRTPKPKEPEGKKPEDKKPAEKK